MRVPFRQYKIEGLAVENVLFIFHHRRVGVLEMSSLQSLPCVLLGYTESFLFFNEAANLATLSHALRASSRETDGCVEQVTLSNLRYRPSFNEDALGSLRRMSSRCIYLLDMRSCMALDDATLEQIVVTCGKQLREIYLDGTDVRESWTLHELQCRALCVATHNAIVQR